MTLQERLDIQGRSTEEVISLRMHTEQLLKLIIEKLKGVYINKVKRVGKRCRPILTPLRDPSGFL